MRAPQALRRLREKNARRWQAKDRQGRPQRRAVRAIVSRGGRPDLAETPLGEVKAPTLLLVGGADPEVLTLNREALNFLRCEKSLEVVPQATHLFEEPDTLEHVARSASSWFVRHLAGRSVAAATA